jgi:glutamine synthetase
MIRQKSKTILEYIWIGGRNEIRSKTRVIHKFLSKNIHNIPNWNYDGSSTFQADSDGNTEIVLKPCEVYKNPLIALDNAECYLVLCDTYNSNGNPTPTNHRHLANELFEKGVEHEPWFGLEQEYFMECGSKSTIDSDSHFSFDGFHYCGKSVINIERKIAEEHMIACIEAGLNISGINSEVANFQWEFQIGPCEGIIAADQLTIARYLLERISEKYDVKINYHPKPNNFINGSGCHINFSTYRTRYTDGLEEINRCINYLSQNHDELIKVYGSNNDLRLTGYHETSSYDKFTWGIGTRNTSVRIPNQVFSENCGYFEDRRPAANIDPYLATSNLFKICCLNPDDL